MFYIFLASSQLENYKRDLVNTRQQLSMATEELTRRNQPEEGTRSMTEAERNELRQELAAKLDKVHKLLRNLMLTVSHKLLK